MKKAWPLALLLLQTGGFSQSVTHSCNIAVVDSDGAEIAKAHIFIHRDPISTTAIPDRILDADAHGKFQLNLPAGFYDVCVMSSAFTPSCQKADIRNRDANVKFKLWASSEVLEQIGDKFPAR